MSRLRDCFTKGDIRLALDEANDSCGLAAKILTDMSGRRVSRQNVEYWRKFLGGDKPETNKPRILVFDIETAPMKQYIWSLWQKFNGLDMNISEWYCLSYAAKWFGEDEIFYQDLRGNVDSEDDTEILRGIHALLCEADIVITQNGNSFDIKKLNARFLLQGFDKPTPFKKIDTLLIAKKEFGFTSNKLEWMTDKINKKYKKLKHGKFAGFELWKQCLAENKEAWEEMEMYNKYDVLSLEELYINIRGWDSKHLNMNLFNDNEEMACNVCGSTDLVKNGFARTNLSKFQQYKCNCCGKPDLRDRTNVLTKGKRESLLMNVGT